MQTRRGVHRRPRSLSPRQKKILTCYGAGMSQLEVAKALKMNLCELEQAEALISDQFKEYEMADCARLWQQQIMAESQKERR